MQNILSPGPATGSRSELLEEMQVLLLSDNPSPNQVTGLLRQDARLAHTSVDGVLYNIVAQINAALFPPITKLELIHTEGCNLACEYCFEKEMLGYRRMHDNVGQKAIDLLLDYSRDKPAVSITHFGGEPLVNFRAVRQMTEYAEREAKHRGKTITFSMTSNGVLIDDAKAEYLAEHKIMVLLSVDGLKDTHDKYRVDKRGRGTFEQVIRGLQVLKRTQRWIGVKMTVMPDNAASLLRDVLGLYELGVNQFVIGYATGISWSESEMQIYVEQWGKVYQWYKENPRDDLRMAEFEELEREGNEPVFSCQAGNDSITVTVDGEISPCSKILALNNKEPMVKLGDVRYN